ncbi:MAG: hypothetical protein ACT4OU_10630 [Hyphomicrobium sp.]
MPTPTHIALIAASAAALSGCAGQTSGIGDPAVAPQASVGYALSDKELALNCKELTGRIQLRILQIRDFDAEKQSSSASRALQSGFTTVAGGTTAATDPGAAYANDRAQLEAYNRRLATLNCKTYDLADELRPKDYMVTPTPGIAPPAPAVSTR